ncbi:MAG: hypothetical protein WA705_05630 [Candidatus Ozemobacteraceae bacterium]
MKTKTKEIPEVNKKVLVQNNPEIVQELSNLVGEILDGKGLMRDHKEDVQH